MSRFIDTDAGLINLRHVTRIAEITDRTALGGCRLKIYYLEGGELTTTLADCDAFSEYECEPTIVPAAPGFSIIVVYDEGIFRYPVLAWRIGSSLYAKPISVVDATDHVGRWAIIEPDGQVIEPDGDRFESLAQFHKEVKAREARKAVYTEKGAS